MSKQLFGVDTTVEHNTPQFTLGEKYVSPEGNLYRYVRAAAAKTIGLFYGIGKDFTVTATAIVKTERHALLGVPSFTTSAKATGYDYKHFWIQTAGNFPRIEAAAASADAAGVYTTATAGKVDDGDDTGKLIRGISFTAAAGGAVATTAFAANELSLDQA